MSFVQRLNVLTIAFFVVMLAVGCHPRMMPTSGSEGEYNASSNTTAYEVRPYGKVTMPGKWVTGKYNKATGKQFFYRDDTTTLSVVIAPCANMPYGKKGLEGYEFVQKYYEIESRFQTELQEQTPKLLVEDKDNRYMLWMVHSDGIDQYFLCGVKDCSCNECTYRSFNLKNRRLSEAASKRLLQDMFLGEK